MSRRQEHEHALACVDDGSSGVVKKESFSRELHPDEAATERERLVAEVEDAKLSVELVEGEACDGVHIRRDALPVHDDLDRRTGRVEERRPPIGPVVDEVVLERPAIDRARAVGGPREAFWGRRRRGRRAQSDERCGRDQ